MSDILKRIGSFTIDKDFIFNNPEEVIAALSDVLVVNITDDFVSGQLKYIGYSKHFDIIEKTQGEEIPTYIPVVKNNEKDIKITWVK